LSELANQLEEIRGALADLRTAATDGARARKELDSLFRRVHNLKAAASADGLDDLSHAAHELENVLHSLRTGQSALDDDVLRQLTETSAALSETLLSNLVPFEILNSLKAHEKHALRQSINEGADISVIDASFDVADFDWEFQKLKKKLSSEGEVIAVAPRVESERPEKINFRILYASTTFLTLDKIVGRAVQAGRAAAAVLGKEVQFATDGTDLSIDQSICKVIAHPVLHLVRNAVDHGIEQHGKITITAEEQDDQLRIRVTDDGRGIDPSVIPRIFQPGFSTRNEVSEISGRGVGLDVVKTTIEALGGSITVSSKPGSGSTFQIRVPNPR